MNIKKELVLRELMGEYVLVPCGETVLSYNGLFMLNEVGSFIWKILPEVSDDEEIVERILEEYDIGRQKAEEDVKKYLAALREFDIID